MTTFLIVDLFCGAGGVTEGFEQAQVPGVEFRVLAGVNHDAKAIESHAANHPNTHHFTEDIRDMEVARKVAALLKNERSELQRIGRRVLVVLHASLECTNFSNAKGGKPRDGDSRSLAEFMPMYIKALSPDYFTVENVREFMSWGPLDDKGKPISRQKGREYVRWTRDIEELGYCYSHRLLNAADYGAYTSRLRYYAMFSKNGMPVAWPEPTHAKTPKASTMYNEKLKKWMPVREVLDLSEKGESIFTRKIPLVEKTLKRIFAGLIKHVVKGDKEFLQKHYSGDPEGKCVALDVPAGAMTTTDSHSLASVEPFLSSQFSGNDDCRVMAIDNPASTITTQSKMSLVTPEPFVMTYYSGSNDNRLRGMDEPCLTVTTENRHAIVSPEFLLKYNGTEKEAHSTDVPCGALSTKDRFSLVSSSYLMTNQHSNLPKSLDEPAPTLLTGNRVTDHHHYLVTTNHGGATHSLEVPSPVIIARQDKAPIGMVTLATGSPYWEINSTDSEAMVKIKQFMRAAGIADIYMRMLMVKELLLIQGFPAGYVLKGTQTDQKKFIGNSVVPRQMKVWAEALGRVCVRSAGLERE